MLSEWIREMGYVHKAPKNELDEIRECFDPIKGDGAVNILVPLPLNSEQSQQLHNGMLSLGLNQIFRAEAQSVLFEIFGNSSALSQVENFIFQISKLMSQLEQKEMVAGHWGFRTEAGRKILEPGGHQHPSPDIYCTGVTALIGPGTWYRNRYSEKQIAVEGETVLLCDGGRALKVGGNSELAVWHGTPNWPHKRLIFFFGPHPVEM